MDHGHSLFCFLLQPSKPGRKWFISPYSDKNPVWTMFAAAIPAILALVLIFMDQQITAVIVNRKENKLVVSFIKSSAFLVC